MPKSRVRKKSPFTPPPTRSVRKRPSPRWVAPLMLACFLIGIIWLVVFYITSGDVPGLRGLGNWNLMVGFAFIVAGFGLSTQWR